MYVIDAVRVKAVDPSAQLRGNPPSGWIFRFVRFLTPLRRNRMLSRFVNSGRNCNCYVRPLALAGQWGSAMGFIDAPEKRKAQRGAVPCELLDLALTG